MLKKTAFYTIFLIVILSAVNTLRAQTKTPIKATFPVSAGAAMFIVDLQNEMNTSKKKAGQFVPSVKLVNQYNLQKNKGRYFAEGFIKTDSSFTPRRLERMKVQLGKPSGAIRTVRIPILVFPDFLKQKGIIYFEIAKKLSHD